MIHDSKHTTKIQNVLNATEGRQFTIYHESLKNVTFCAVKPPFFPGYLRAGFNNDRGDWDVGTNKVSR